MYVIATAGHVDHGKSTLVQAITGMQPDRWAAERERGMTIDLGFVWTTLPSGDEVAFVDVPGHERFLANMLAGVGPAPAVLLMVAADDGWSRQSGEHLAALDALGVRHGLLVITRADLADPGPALAQSREQLAETSLAGIPSVAVSAITGFGMADLGVALQALVERLPPPDPAADVRLWIDRSFTIAGRGTVVTGTLTSGCLQVGDRLLLGGARSPQLVTVRGLHTLNRAQQKVTAAARVAVNLKAIAAEEIHRGDALLTPDRWMLVRIVDVALSRSVPASDERFVLHVGAAEVSARVRPLGEGAARLTLARPLPLRISDNGVLRDPGRQQIACGVRVLDVAPPALTRRGDARRRGAELGDAASFGRLTGELSRRKLVPLPALQAMGVAVSPALPDGALPAGVLRLSGDYLVDALWWAELGRELRAQVQAHGEQHPQEPGLPIEAARQRLKLPNRSLVDALTSSAGAALHAEDGRLFGVRRGAQFPPAILAALAELCADLTTRPFDAPDANRLVVLGLDSKALSQLAGAGQLLHVGSGIYLLPGADAMAVRSLRGLTGIFTLSEARKHLDTTRRVAVPLLEFLDRRGLTVRVDDTHRRVRDE